MRAYANGHKDDWDSHLRLTLAGAKFTINLNLYSMAHGDNFRRTVILASRSGSLFTTSPPASLSRRRTTRERDGGHGTGAVAPEALAQADRKAHYAPTRTRNQLTFDTKTDDNTERRLVHTLAHAIVFIVSICCL